MCGGKAAQRRISNNDNGPPFTVFETGGDACSKRSRHNQSAKKAGGPMNQSSRIPFNKVLFLTLALCLVLIPLSPTALGQSDKAQKIDALMKPFVHANQFSGVVLASENGKVIYEKAFRS